MYLMGYQEEKNRLEVFSRHLSKMGIPYKFKDIGNESEIFPAIVCTYKHGELDFDVVIYNIADWIHVKCLVLETIGLPSQIQLSIFKLALSLNYDLPETTFSLYNDNLYIELDCLNDVDYDDFVEEFNSIPTGLNIFLKTIKKEESEIEISSTKGAIEKDQNKIKK